MSQTTPVALSIAGSDSGCGAGIQADLRVFSQLGVFGTTAITAVTAQNLDGIRSVEGLSVGVVLDQVKAVLQGFRVGAVKTGMLWSADVVRGVAAVLEEAEVVDLVVDPVMVATTGIHLAEKEAIDAIGEGLIPRCSLLTPNLDEAAVLLGRDAIEARELEDVARELVQRHGCSVLLKGGHLKGPLVDVLCLLEDERVIRYPQERVSGVNTHGTGCMLSAAIAALLARGHDLEGACAEAISFVHEALASPHKLSNSACLPGIERAGSAVTPSRRRP